MNGETIAEMKDLQRRVAQLAPGKDATISIIRDGKPVDITVAIATMPGEKEMAKVEPQSTSGAERTNLADLGVSLRQADDGAGVEITEVKPNSPAAEIGLSAGDLILEVAGKTVASPADVKKEVAHAAGSGQKRVLLLVRSGDRQRFVAIPVKKG